MSGRSKSEVFDEVFGSFEISIDPKRTALLSIDMQYLDAHRDYGMGRTAKERGLTEKYEYYFQQVEQVVTPNIQRLQSVCRENGIEVIHARIGSLVHDCRDVSLEHKRLDLLAPQDSDEIEILDAIKPLPNEVVLTKGASGVFNATAIDQILRNMGITTLIITGVVTNYCVETAARNAGDRGYDVIVVSDGCAAMSEEDHAFALRILDNVYCRVHDTETVLEKIADGLAMGTPTIGALAASAS